ncbi:MAG: ATP-dependent Clp protease adaptor ClpS [bacterium]|nr:ATP-dependent Clp protease adaptor ClpS [bacterium]
MPAIPIRERETHRLRGGSRHLWAACLPLRSFRFSPWQCSLPCSGYSPAVGHLLRSSCEHRVRLSGGGGVPGDQRDEGLATEERKKTKRPERYKVLLYNDDYTPMDFVVNVLVEIFGKSPAAATQIMLQVHKGGLGVAGVYVREVAETKVSVVHRAAEERGYPLRSGVEKE